MAQFEPKWVAQLLRNGWHCLNRNSQEDLFFDYNSAQQAVAIACSTYNYLRPHGSIDNLKPFEAHQKNGEIPKRWKNYYQINKRKEMEMVN